jgi:hypothetical protein
MLKRISVCNLEAGVGFCTAWLPTDNGPVRCGRGGGLSASSRYHSTALSYFTQNHINLSAKSNMTGLALQESSGTSRCLLLTSLVDTVSASCKGFTFLLIYLHFESRAVRILECFSSSCNPSSFRHGVPRECETKHDYSGRNDRYCQSVHIADKVFGFGENICLG